MAYKGPTISTTFNAKDKISGPMKKMKGNMKAFAGVAVAAIGAIATGKMAQAVNDFANAGDEIAKTSRQIGLSAEALQELRFAADRSGISSQDFTKSMQQMNKFVGQARVGTGALVTMLNKSNPELLEQLKLVDNSEDAFNLLVKELDGMTNQMDKSALANAAFGRSGTGFLIMAENGVDGIAELREEARKYGNIIGTDATLASEKFVDSMTNMKASMLGLKNKAIAPLIDKLQPLIQSVADYVAENQEVINSGIAKVFETIGKAVKFLSDKWKSGLIPAMIAGVALIYSIVKAVAAYNAILTVATSIQTAFNLAMSANVISLIIIGIAALIAVIVIIIKHWETVVRWLKEAWAWMTRVYDAIKPLIIMFGGFAAPLIFIIEIFRSLINNFAEIKAAFQDQGFLAGILAIGKALLEGLLEPLKSVFDFLMKVKDGLGSIAGKIRDKFGGGMNLTPEEQTAYNQSQGIFGKNDGVISSQSTSTTNWQGTLNIAGAPTGSSFSSKGQGPTATMDTGYRRARF